MESFAVRLKELRQNKAVSQKIVGNAVGISDRAYYDFERGKSKPAFETLIALADYFGVSIDYLTGRTDKPEQKNLDDMLVEIDSFIKRIASNKELFENEYKKNGNIIKLIRKLEDTHGYKTNVAKIKKEYALVEHVTPCFTNICTNTISNLNELKNNRASDNSILEILNYTIRIFQDEYTAQLSEIYGVYQQFDRALKEFASMV